MDLNRIDLAGKTVLEVGSGRGDTTRKLVDLLLPDLPNDLLRAAFVRLADDLRSQAALAGEMEMPFYRLSCHK